MRVKSLHIYPVKSMQGCALDGVVLTEKGPEHDRLWMVTDENYRFLTQRQKSQMATIKTEVLSDGELRLETPDGKAITLAPPQNTEIMNAAVWKDNVAVFDAGEEAAEFISDFLGERCRFVYQVPDAKREADPEYSKSGDHVSLADGFPLLLTNTASLDALDLPDDITMDRFRANIVLEGLEAFEEDDIHILKIGDVEIELVKPCSRCVVTTKDQKTGEQISKEPIATLAKLRRGTKGVYFGQNAIPRKLGTIKAGDKVEIISRKSEPVRQLAPVKLSYKRR